MSFLTKSVRKIAVGRNNLISKTCYHVMTSVAPIEPIKIPSNLKLAKESALYEIEKKAPISKDSTLFLFPPLDIPKTIGVSVFSPSGPYPYGKAEQSDLIANLDRRVFGVAIRKDIVHEVIRYLRAKLRQPKKTKRMSEIRGSNKKPRPQKGGGQSQAGHKRNSVWRGGQKAHGPVLRDYSIGMNRKYRAMGMMIALAAKYQEGNLIVFDKISCETHKTKELMKVLGTHDLLESSVLIIDDMLEENFLMAVSNIPHADPMPQLKANVYDIVKREKLAMSLSAFYNIQERLLEQYFHNGRKKAMLRDLNTYTMAALEAEEAEEDDEDDQDDYEEEGIKQ